MTQYILLIWVILVPGQPAAVYSMSAAFTYQTCSALISARIQDALREFPAANVRGECLPMVAK